MEIKRPAGVILAGGRSSRMGGSRKALLELNGRPLLTHVIDRLQAHLDPLMLSCDSETSEFESFGLPLVPDLLPGFRGPLTGLYSALQYLADKGQQNSLVLCPCDAPFIPHKLVQTLLNADQKKRKTRCCDFIPGCAATDLLHVAYPSLTGNPRGSSQAGRWWPEIYAEITTTYSCGMGTC